MCQVHIFNKQMLLSALNLGSFEYTNYLGYQVIDLFPLKMRPRISTVVGIHLCGCNNKTGINGIIFTSKNAMWTNRPSFLHFLPRKYNRLYWIIINNYMHKT